MQICFSCKGRLPGASREQRIRYTHSISVQNRTVVSAQQKDEGTFWPDAECSVYRQVIVFLRLKFNKNML